MYFCEDGGPGTLLTRFPELAKKLQQHFEHSEKPDQPADPAGTNILTRIRKCFISYTGIK